MHGTWNSRLTMPMWLRGVPPRAHDTGQLVEDRGEEGGPGVAHHGDDTFGARVHEVEDVVRPIEDPPRALHGRVGEDPVPPTEGAHGR